jgi:hypothetical protein
MRKSSFSRDHHHLWRVVGVTVSLMCALALYVFYKTLLLIKFLVELDRVDRATHAEKLGASYVSLLDGPLEPLRSGIADIFFTGAALIFIAGGSLLLHVFFTQATSDGR